MDNINAPIVDQAAFRGEAVGVHFQQDDKLRVESRDVAIKMCEMRLD